MYRSRRKLQLMISSREPKRSSRTWRGKSRCLRNKTIKVKRWMHYRPIVLPTSLHYTHTVTHTHSIWINILGLQQVGFQVFDISDDFTCCAATVFARVWIAAARAAAAVGNLGWMRGLMLSSTLWKSLCLKSSLIGNLTLMPQTAILLKKNGHE